MNNRKSVCIVLCSKGYPESYRKNIHIKGLDNLKQTYSKCPQTIARLDTIIDRINNEL